MRVSLWYPSEVASGVVRLGPFEFPATRDAAPAAGLFGLVVLSHGWGGSDLGHRDTALALARAGFIAAAPLHSRSNFRDTSGAGQRIVWESRPREVSAVIDALLQHPTWARHIDVSKIGAFGFSFGGYTVLAVLGAEAQPATVIDHCRRHAAEDRYCEVGDLMSEAARTTRAKIYAGPPISAHDARVCAAVIADPVGVVFSAATLQAMAPVKLLFYRPEQENVLAARFHISHVITQLKQRGDFPAPQEIVVPKAHHYSFIAPFPEAIARSVPELAFDAPGFDRVAFHEAMNGTIVTFFKKTLSACMEN
jgi:predicted dienelactone hydrolase